MSPMRFLSSTRFLGSLRFLGILTIVVTVIVVLISAFVAWKVVVASKKTQADVFKQKFDQVILQGTDVGGAPVSDDYKRLILEIKTETSEEYKVASRIFIGYVAGMLVGSVSLLLLGSFYSSWLSLIVR